MGSGEEPTNECKTIMFLCVTRSLGVKNGAFVLD